MIALGRLPREHGRDVPETAWDQALTRSPHCLHHSCPRRLLASERRVHRVVEAAVIEVRGLTKRYGDVVAVDDLSLRRRAGTGDRVPRSQRGRQVHHHADGAGAGPPDIGGGARARPAVRVVRRAAAGGGRVARPRVVHPGRTGRNHLRVAARTNGIGRPPRRRGRRAGRPGGRGPPPHHGLLARHAPAARHRRRPCSATRACVLFDEPINGLDLDGVRWMRDAAPTVGGRGTDGAGLQPPDERDAADRRPARGDRSRATASPTRPRPRS